MHIHSHTSQNSYAPCTHTHTICTSLDICTHILAAPPTKKYKKEKKSKMEKAIEKTMDVFVKSQADADERFQM